MNNELTVDYLGFCNLILKIAFLLKGLEGKQFEEILEKLLDVDLVALRIKLALKTKLLSQIEVGVPVPIDIKGEHAITPDLNAFRHIILHDDFKVNIVIKMY